MAHVFQVGAGSGGMPVLDLLCHDGRVTEVTLIEPDIYKPHNVERHLFPMSGIGEPKATMAAGWLKERRPDLKVRVLRHDLLAREVQSEVDEAARQADIGVCAADNEAAKSHFDEVMRRHRKPWTLGEVLSGGIGGFVHWFIPGGPCYGCVSSYLQRSVRVEMEKAPDYSLPGAPLAETAIPAGAAAIHAIASLHALVTVGLLTEGLSYQPDFTSLLFTLQRVPGVFDQAYRAHRFRIPRAPDCLVCGGAGARTAPMSAEDLDVALDQALARLGDA
jgi:molybdopterin/thiamine biosynthesis adenylyltransferase